MCAIQLFGIFATLFFGVAPISFLVSITSTGIFEIFLSILVLKDIKTAIRPKRTQEKAEKPYDILERFAKRQKVTE